MSERRPVLSSDEVSIVLRADEDQDLSAIANYASVCSTWRDAVDEYLDSLLALRPAQIFADRLKLRAEACHLALTPDGDVLLSDCTNHRILIYSSCGLTRRSIGSFGFGDGQLNYPKGVACDGRFVFVSDRSNCRVQKLRLADGACAAKAGARGFSDGCLINPQGLALGSSGPLVLVADSGNDRVAVFEDCDGDELRWLGSVDGTDLAGGLASGGPLIAVTDGGSHSVALFSCEPGPGFVGHGRLRRLRTIGERGHLPGQFLQPVGVSLAHGRLYVCEGEGRRLQVLSLHGESLQVLQMPGRPRLSGVCAHGAHGLLVVAHTAAAAGQVRLLTTIVRPGRDDASTPPVGSGVVAEAAPSPRGHHSSSAGLALESARSLGRELARLVVAGSGTSV